MIISGMSGNEIYCLMKKGFIPGEIVVGNSVFSLGIAGWVGSVGRALAGGEIVQITQLIAEGRHAAIGRMEHEARRHGASGVTGVVSDVKALAGFTEFLSQGTSVTTRVERPFFSTSASGIDLYCHLDAGYQPMRFAMGNVAYALGFARGLTGTFRTLARGEVREFSQMYNELRHTALHRLRVEAAASGANSVVDLDLRMLPHASAIELLITGTASWHPRLSQGPVAPEHVATSELTGEELWNIAKLGYAPVQLVMGTSVYSLGFTGGLGAMFQGMSRGELPEVTSLIYHARENALDLVRREAMALGAERVIGNKLVIQEIAPGIIEIFAVGTAIRPMQGMEPETPDLIVQAVIVDRESEETGGPIRGLPGGMPSTAQAMMQGMGGQQRAPVQLSGGCGLLLALFFVFVPLLVGIVSALAKAAFP